MTSCINAFFDGTIVSSVCVLNHFNCLGCGLQEFFMITLDKSYCHSLTGHLETTQQIKNDGTMYQCTRVFLEQSFQLLGHKFFLLFGFWPPGTFNGHLTKCFSWYSWNQTQMVHTTYGIQSRCLALRQFDRLVFRHCNRPQTEWPSAKSTCSMRQLQLITKTNTAFKNR